MFSEYTNRELFAIAVICFIHLVIYIDRFSVVEMESQALLQFELESTFKDYANDAYIIALTMMAPIYGYLGDRRSRKQIIIVTLWLWSATTLATAFTPLDWRFFVARAFVGIFQSAFCVIATSMIADIVQGAPRSVALTHYSLMIPIGVMLGHIVPRIVQNIGGPWWWNFYFQSALVFALPLLLLVCEDPKRGLKEVEHATGERRILKATSYKEDIKSLIYNKTFLVCSCASTFVYFMFVILTWYGADMLRSGNEIIAEREKNERPLVSRTVFSSTTLLAGIIGVPLGSFLSRLLMPVIQNVDPLICGMGVLISIPLIALAALTCNLGLWEAYFYLFIAEISFNMVWAVSLHIYQYTVVPTRRCSFRAWQIVIGRVLGDGIGPVFITEMRELFLQLYDFKKLERLNSMPDIDIKPFYTLRASILSALVIHILGSVIFFWASVFVSDDAENASDEIVELALQQKEAENKSDETLDNSKT